MKLKMIALAAVMAVSGAANAASIDLGATGATSYNGSVVFSIWDNNSSYSLNLNTGVAGDSISGINSFLSTITAAPGSSLTFAADSTLTSWLSNANVAALEWNVTAINNGTTRSILTSADLPVLPSAESSTTARAGITSATTIFNNVNANGTQSSANDSVIQSNTPGYIGNAAFGTNFGGGINFTDASSALGTSMQMAVLNVKSTGGTNVTQAFDGVTASLDSKGDLTFSAPVAAVPEADTYAMLLAGLGAMGVIVRRRRAA